MPASSTFDDSSYAVLFAKIDAVKHERERFEHDIAEGNVALEAVFSNTMDNPVLSTMKVLPAIEALPEAGKVSTRRAFGDLGISETARIGEVDERQIAGLPDAIRSHTR